jgi:hypothetical protein
VGLLMVARAPVELAEAKVAVGDEGAHAEGAGDRERVAIVELGIGRFGTLPRARPRDRGSADREKPPRSRPEKRRGAIARPGRAPRRWLAAARPGAPSGIVDRPRLLVRRRLALRPGVQAAFR